MSLRYYGANATLSTISTTSFSHQQVTNKNNQAKEIMKEDKKNLKKEQSNPKAEEQTASQPVEKKVNKQPVSILSVLAIALTLCLGGFIYYHAHQQAQSQQRTIAELQTEIANLKQTTKKSVVTDLQSSITDAVNQQNQQFSSFEQRIDRQLAEQQKTQQQLTNQVNDSLKLNEQSIHNLNERLAAMSTTENNVWLISQANYLVNLAGRKIWNDQDYTTARLLLKSADESLAQANDPSLLPARQAISKDIASLSQVSFIDADGIILNLMGLSDELTELPLAGNYKDIDLGMTDYKEVPPETNGAIDGLENNQPTTSEKIDNTATANNEVSSSLDDWSTNLINNAETFMQKFITIEKLDNNKSENNFATCLSLAGQDEKQIVKCQILNTPISLEQSLYLRENIRFRLLIAAQAVPRHQEVIYQRALNDVSIWVNAYFDSDSSSVKAFLNDLENLQHQSISNQYAPEKLASSGELEKLMQTRVRSALAK